MTKAEARFNKSLRPRKPKGSLGRTAQDGHLDSHTAPELGPATYGSFYGYMQMRRVTRLLEWKSAGAGAAGQDGRGRGGMRGRHGDGVCVELALAAAGVALASVGRHTAAVVGAEDVVVLAVEHGAQVVGHAEPQRLLLTHHGSVGTSCTHV